jgi:hypothetical protein
MIQPGSRIGIGIGIGIEVINGCSIFLQAKSIPIPIAPPMAQMFA